ncbi:Meiotic recombination protein DMC1/LIM15-like protein [Frankliniella fusca]|uniref:Meiotic recombination protein DMC1/LIM15-like protein n=1 Tax=Frankliniella fusca TaxID=407009 RepID=A0AAE1HP38_9NEOP|nr:Meiotic recombination protein DMC1/LIM15-like protein [Frankliniella fusca]KAK3924790.1 Meiotic recombination protein DMC1/LIM15-like protein [Frankliniella fusca]KAK3929218.1 Meiotic recombination protein DMC1/LIM15-like protein [Frankliniella fusca]KAK3931393.1 Meiotic recombination protein DMC1/LIM15-like protein [Frankliniella fusca]
MVMEELELDDDIFFSLPDDNNNPILDEIWDRNDSDAERRAAFDSATPTTSKQSSKKKGGKKADPTKPRLPCHHCTKTYANENTLKTHLNGVAMRDMALRSPNVEQLREKLEELSEKTLNDIANKFKVGDLALNCVEYAKSVKEKDRTNVLDYLAVKFKSVFSWESVVFVSHLREKFITNTNKLLCDQEFREELRQLFSSVLIFHDESSSNFFITEFVMSLSTKIFVYVSETMRNQPSQAPSMEKRGSDDFSSLRFKRLVHYIGGSAVAGIKRRSKNYPSSVKFMLFHEIILQNFVEDKDDPSTHCTEDIKSWTATQSRGGLMFINVKAFDFFYELITLTLSHEEYDGSLILEKVHESVKSNYKIVDMWDALICSDESEALISLEWLSCIVDIICRCISRGIMKRRINEAIEKPVNNVAHRALLAR